MRRIALISGNHVDSEGVMNGRSLRNVFQTSPRLIQIYPIRTVNSVKRRSYPMVYSRLPAVSSETEDRKLALTAAFFPFFSSHSLVDKCQIIYENRKIGTFSIISYICD